MGFDWAPRLAGSGLTLTPAGPEDLPGLLAAASDPAIWTGHPARDRWRPEVAGPFFAGFIAAQGALTLRETASGLVIGCSRYYPPPAAAHAVAIGFTFLVREHWGGRTNRQMKSLMLDHAFKSFETVQFHVAPANLRSLTATRRLGAREVAWGDVDLGAGPKPYVTLELSRRDWAGPAPEAQRRNAAVPAPQDGATRARAWPGLQDPARQDRVPTGAPMEAAGQVADPALAPPGPEAQP